MQSRKEKRGEYVPDQVCKATKGELLKSKRGLDVLDDCPLCLKRGVALEVGYHRSDQPAGTTLME